MSISFTTKKLIELFGQSVQVKIRQVTVDDDGIVISDTYSQTISTTAWIVPIRGLRELWEVVGFGIQGDYSAAFLGSSTISVGDRVVLPDGTETETREVIQHYHRDTVDIKEAILVKIAPEV